MHINRNASNFPPVKKHHQKLKTMNPFKTLCLLCLVVVMTSCLNSTHQKESSSVAVPKLELLWETDTLLTTCESVLYDKSSSVIYVANVNNSPWELDHNGFISTIDTNGHILELKWIEGLSGPKGMGIADNKLYVNDIDRVVEIDIAARKIVASYPVEGEPALNDITVTPEGIIYVSGSASNTIYSLQNGKLDTVVSDTFGRLNGLLYQSEGLYFLTSQSQRFGIYDLNAGTTEILTEGIGHGDGAVVLENGDLIVSSWKGEVYYIRSADWSKKQLLDTREAGINAADIAFIQDQHMLLVPTFFHNRVMCYRLVYE